MSLQAPGREGFNESDFWGLAVDDINPASPIVSNIP